MNTDIDDRKRSEEELTRERETTPDVVTVIAGDGRCCARTRLGAAIRECLRRTS